MNHQNKNKERERESSRSIFYYISLHYAHSKDLRQFLDKGLATKKTLFKLFKTKRKFLLQRGGHQIKKILRLPLFIEYIFLLYIYYIFLLYYIIKKIYNIIYLVNSAFKLNQLTGFPRFEVVNWNIVRHVDSSHNFILHRRSDPANH